MEYKSEYFFCSQILIFHEITSETKENINKRVISLLIFCVAIFGIATAWRDTKKFMAKTYRNIQNLSVQNVNTEKNQ